jgi:hypothetical protein
MRVMMMAALVAVAGHAASAGAATAEEPSSSFWETVRAATVEASIAAEHAIVVGGVLVYRNRHAIAGAVLGCAAGSALATTPTVVLALPTAGTSLGAAPAAAAAGCGVGGISGAMLGYRIDNPE